MASTIAQVTKEQRRVQQPQFHFSLSNFGLIFHLFFIVFFVIITARTPLLGNHQTSLPRFLPSPSPFLPPSPSRCVRLCVSLSVFLSPVPSPFPSTVSFLSFKLRLRSDRGGGEGEGGLSTSSLFSTHFHLTDNSNKCYIVVK